MPKRNRNDLLVEEVMRGNYVKPLPGERIEGKSSDIYEKLLAAGIKEDLKFVNKTKKLAYFIREMNKYVSIDSTYGNDGNFLKLHSKFSEWAYTNNTIMKLVDPVYTVLDWSNHANGRQPVVEWDRHAALAVPGAIGVVPRMSDTHLLPSVEDAYTLLGMLLKQYNGVTGYVINLPAAIVTKHT